MYFVYTDWDDHTESFVTYSAFEKYLEAKKIIMEKDHPNSFILTGEANTKHTFIKPSTGYFKEEPI